MNFEKIDSSPWINEAQKRLPFALPGCFSILVRNYVFTGFEISRFHHYDNYDGNEDWCWHIALGKDPIIFNVCNRYHFLPVGQPEQGNYDRICLDINRIHKGDCPVVQLDHEMILQREKIKIVAELAPSYNNLVTRVLGAYRQLDQTDASTNLE
jgi:hypothetical protein